MGLIPEEIIAQVIDRSDIVDVVSSYIPLKPAGRNFKANCPFHHEKTPSFVVNPQKQIFHCFGCGEGGNVVSFVMKQDHVDFRDAIEMLARKVNVELPKDNIPAGREANERQALLNVKKLAVEFFHNNLIFEKSAASKAARQYLLSRGISDETAKVFQLGFAPDQWDGLINFLKGKRVALALLEKAGLIIKREKGDGFYDRFRNRLVFPIFDTREQCRAFGARALAESNAKYINSPETVLYTKGHHLYGFHLAKRVINEKDFVVVVEGYMDCIAPWQYGIENIVASLGTALTVEQIRLIRRYTKNITLLFDADEAGISAMNRSFSILLEEGMNVRIAQLERGQDPDSFVRQYGKHALQDVINQAVPMFDYKLGLLIDRYGADSPQSKAKIVSEMLPIVYSIKSDVETAEYRRKLSYRLDIKEEILVAEYKKMSGEVKPRWERGGADLDVKLTTKIRSVEKDILKLLLHDEQFVMKTKEKALLSDFQDLKMRNVISKVFELFDQGEKINEANLINSLDDQNLQRLVSELMVKEDAPYNDKEKMHDDFMARLKSDRMKDIRKQIMREMREAESSGNQEKMNDLKMKFNQLMKQ